MAKKLVLFSGGIDSTYLLYKNLHEGNDVYCLHNIIENNTVQTVKESKSIKNIIKWLEGRFPGQTIDYRMNDDRYGFMKFRINLVSGGTLIQPFLWMASLPIFLQSYDLNFDEIQYGIIARDDALSYLDDLKAMFDASMMTPLLEKYKGKLTFPLIKYLKANIIDLLPRELLKMTSSCEQDVAFSKYCNYCHSCRTLKEAFRDFDGDLNLNSLLCTKEEIEEYKKRNESKNLKEVDEELKAEAEESEEFSDF